MDVTAFVALLDQLDSADGALATRLGPELPAHVLRQRGLPARLVRARTTVYHFGGEAPTIRNWRLTGGHVACLVEGAEPAATALRLLRGLAPKHAWAYLDGTRGLAASLRERLGADPEAWAHLQRELPDYPGVLPELLEQAAGAPRRAVEAGDATPAKRADRRGRGNAKAAPRVPQAPSAVRVQMRQLLMLLDRDTLAALVPHLDRRTVLDLARFGASLAPETLAWLVSTATARQRLTLAKARWSRPELAAALLDLADPEVNAALYLNAHTSVVIRARIMAAADRVPLHASVVARVCGVNSRAMRLPAVWSGDPLLVRAALLRRTFTNSSVRECLRVWQRDGVDGLAGLFQVTYTQPPSPVDPFRLPRYRSLLLVAVEGVWRRHGSAEAARLVDDLPVVPRDRQRFAEWFGAADGLDLLRAEIAAKTGARTLVKRLRRDNPTKLWPLLETPSVDWRAIAQAERGKPLGPPAWAMLADLPGCPDRPLPEDVDVDRGSAVVGAGHWPASPEVHVPREWTGGRYTVAEPARRGAAMPAEYLFGGVTPAAQALNTYGCLRELTSAVSASLRYHEHLSALVERHLGGSAEARVVAMRLLPDFPGTTEELLETAGAMTLAGV